MNLTVCPCVTFYVIIVGYVSHEELTEPKRRHMDTCHYTGTEEQGKAGRQGHTEEQHPGTAEAAGA